ncbi:tetratricopeptide repeat protein [Patescibacteria group bacterium]|nr:tetratricopeptide repeat protein [Patescibacteria group bacterium]
MITWVKTINYPRAAVKIAEAVEHFGSGDGQSTLAALDRAIELAPDVPVYYYWRADLYLAYLENQEAIPEKSCSLQQDLEYRACLAARSYQSHLIGSQKSPFYYRSRQALANSALRFKRHEDAVDQYRRVLEMVPSSWKLRIRLADAYIQNGQPQAALQPLHESMAIKASTEALFLRGRAYAELGRYHDAILDLDQALQSDPKSARGYVVRALAYAKLGQVAKSQQDIDRAVELGFDRARLERLIRSAMSESSGRQ